MLPTILLVVACQALPSPHGVPAVLTPHLSLRNTVEDGAWGFAAAGDEDAFAVMRTDGRIPYVWPLRDASGEDVTRAFPMEKGRPGEATDHPHHQSLWFTHGDVDGHDFWHDPECRIVIEGDPWVTLRPELFQSAFTQQLTWTAPGKPVVLREERTYRFVAAKGIRLVEVESTLTAPSAEVDADGVLFGDTKEGSFALRLRPELRLKGAVAVGTISNSEGQVNGDCWGQRAQWVTYDAPLGQKRLSVTIMDHTKNLRHPTRWHARDYGLVAANPFGVHGFGGGAPGAGDFRLAPGKSLTQRYLVVVAESELDGEIEAALAVKSIEAVYRWWVTLRHPKVVDPSRPR